MRWKYTHIENYIMYIYIVRIKLNFKKQLISSVYTFDKKLIHNIMQYMILVYCTFCLLFAGIHYIMFKGIDHSCVLRV